MFCKKKKVACIFDEVFIKVDVEDLMFGYV